MNGITVKADFSYRDAFGTHTPAAYETLLLDVMMGDATLFTRGDEVEAEWRIVTLIEQAWAQRPAGQELSQFCANTRVLAHMLAWRFLFRSTHSARSLAIRLRIRSTSTGASAASGETAR